MKNTILILLAIFLSYNAFPQTDLVWKNVLNEKFNNNTNGWYVGSEQLRKASISNGQLIDYFWEDGKAQANRINVYLNSNRDYKIEFSISNLNNSPNKKYGTYEKRDNGKLKERWVENPTWGFVWGFKDWNNYNCILFVNSSSFNNTKFKVFSKSNGTTITHLDWSAYIGFKIQDGTNKNVISINKVGNEVLLINELFDVPICVIKNAKWYGNKIGSYIGAGAKIALDYVTVQEKKSHTKTNWSEYSLKTHWKSSGVDIIEGIYENAIKDENSPKYKLALIKSKVGYSLIYLSGATNTGWNTGDIKAYLTKTATPNFFKVIWFMGNKMTNDDLYISFEGGIMKVIWTDRQENLYIKLYPTSNDNVTSSSVASSGTGFALSTDGYIVTNYHVTKDAKSIKIRGVKGNFSRTYNAELIVEDKNNDLAIIKINDAAFTTLGTPPYKIENTVSNPGTSVYALGYPLRATMGDEVKLTNGIISSKTGFQGDITSYQVSVPVQPGNSGGPLFNSKGNVIGIINAKHIGAENASYAIKTNYLINLLQVMNSSPSLPATNSISNKGLSDQVKYVKEFVYLIEVK